MTEFQKQVARLAGYVQNGELLAQTDPAAFVSAVVAEIERLQRELSAAQSRLYEATQAGTPYAADRDAKNELVLENQRLRAIVGRLPRLVEIVAIDAIRNFVAHGHEMSERDCYPSLYQRGRLWRYHRRVAGNEWEDSADPIEAAEAAQKERP